MQGLGRLALLHGGEPCKATGWILRSWSVIWQVAFPTLNEPGWDEGKGCVERFIRTLKEQLLWVRTFRTVEELRQALTEFRERYNQRWIVQRHGYRTPQQARQQLLAQGAAA